ncbi:YIP1 family protein [Cohnella yongneupensis]|uniref:YIP1 family protein n=1 Tax=Cohnella yongneupensis TaxID=425006 RepID=A0ABW0R1K8_9BACL
MKRLLAFLLLAAVIGLTLPGTASARLPYQTTYFDKNQSVWIKIQELYKPKAAYGGMFGEPVDLTVGSDDKVYVADKGNDAIYVLDNDGNLIKTIGDEEGPGSLSSPEGVFVTPEGQIYVADSGNQRIAVFAADGTFAREYKKPETDLLATEHFVPIKLVVDRRGVMYIDMNSSYQGLVRISPEGEFMGYFGANKAPQSLLNWLKKLILNKQQLAKEDANLPRPIANVSIDDDGFIYTSTGGDFGKAAIRKLNAGGIDGFKGRDFQHSQGIVDVAIDSNGFMYNVDQDFGRVNIFDRTGDVLFAFGFTDVGTQQKGVFGFPTSVGIDSKNNIWVADSGTKTVHKFYRTEFGNDVMNALTLYYDGKYEESKPYWEHVYSRNELFNGTYEGLGKVYLEEQNNDKALDFMKEAFDTKGYSQAFWEIRLDWLQNNFLGLIGGLVALYLLLRYIPRGVRKLTQRRPVPEKLNRPLAELRNFFYVMFHPYEGFYRLKEARVSPWIMALLLVSVLIMKIMTVYWTGFLFHPVLLQFIDIYRELELFVLPWVTWIIANYLVCSIKDGEGKFREVIQGSTYALAPYLVFSVPILILSNVLSLDEKVLIGSLTSLMYLWMAVMFFVMTQVIHNFEFVETIKNSLITVFTIATIWLFGFIIFGLSYNLYDFIYQLYKEVSLYR